MIGTLTTFPAADRTDLLAAPVAAALVHLGLAGVHVAEIDPDLADTAAFCEHYGVGLDVSANCVVVSGVRGGQARTAACVVLASARADVNGVVRRRLDVRKASFTSMAQAVEQTGMEYGGITPLGLPGDWPLLIDEAVARAGLVVVGSGRRLSKLVVPGALVASLPGAEVLSLAV